MRVVSQLPANRHRQISPSGASRSGAVPGGRPTSQTIRRRRAAAAAILVAVGAVAIVLLTQSGGGTSVRSSEAGARAPASGRVRIQLDGRTLADLPIGHLEQPRAQATLVGEVPAIAILKRGAAKISLQTDRRVLGARIDRAVAVGGGAVQVPGEAISSSIRVPVVKQVLKDDCEATALSMILAYAGHPAEQLALQEQIPRSGPLDPEQGPNGEVWGDPRLGFVGRADGSGPAGGFGVYQAPISAVARRHGVKLRDLSHKSPEALYNTLLAGRPIMAWVALSEGPYAIWNSPTGKVVHVNYGEHAVVLTGVNKDEVTVNDPLSGERLKWPKTQFEAMWAGLGSRALAA